MPFDFNKLLFALSQPETRDQLAAQLATQMQAPPDISEQLAGFGGLGALGGAPPMQVQTPPAIAQAMQGQTPGQLPQQGQPQQEQPQEEEKSALERLLAGSAGLGQLLQGQQQPMHVPGAAPAFAAQGRGQMQSLFPVMQAQQRQGGMPTLGQLIG